MQRSIPAARPVRIILADDHALLRSGLGALLENVEGVEVIAEAGDGEELIKLAEALDPDIVFTDIAMPGMDGIDAVGHLKQSRPAIRCVIVSMHGTGDMVKRAAAAGAAGYVMKNSSAHELRQAIDEVMSRGSYFSPAITALLLSPADPGPTDLLTSRQIEILKMMARGLSTKEIAYELDLSPKTVDAHRARIMTRLDLADIASLTRYAVKHGLVAI